MPISDNKYLSLVSESIAAIREDRLGVLQTNQKNHPVIAHNMGVSIETLDSLALYMAERLQNNLAEDEGFDKMEFIDACKGLL
jgi:hypothetical protein